MKKLLLPILAFAFLVLLAPVVVTHAVRPEIMPEKSEHEHMVKSKWDMSGEFVAHPGYNWKGLAEGYTWEYDIHVKEAMNGEYSVGSIHFKTDGINVVGHVEETKTDYLWGDLAAVGMANYDGEKYYFMFLVTDYAMWFSLSDTDYEIYWDAGSIWGGAQRVYQLHSLNPGTSIDLDGVKEIH